MRPKQICELICDWEFYWKRRARGEKPVEPGNWIYYLEIAELGVNPSTKVKEANIVARYEPIQDYRVMPEQPCKQPLEVYGVTKWNARNRPVAFARGSLAAEEFAYRTMKKVRECKFG